MILQFQGVTSLLSFRVKTGLVCLCKKVLVCFCVGSLMLTLLQSVCFAIESKNMPLAEKSLLLDGQVTGDLIVVVGDRGHVLLSEDHGRTWQQQTVPTQTTLTSVFFIDSVNGWVAGHDSVILRTEDGGYSWREVYVNEEDERPILDLWFSGRDHGYAMGGYGLFLESTDGGESWSPVDFIPENLFVEGDTLNDLNGEGGWVDFHLNDITSAGQDRVFISAEAGKIYRSNDNGLSWLSLPSPYNGSFYGSLHLAGDELLLFGLRGNLFYTGDAGVNWSRIDSGTQSTLNDGLRLVDGRVVVAGLAGALLVSNDGGKSFESHAQPDRAGISKILETKDNALILIGEQGVRRLAVPAKTTEAGK